MGEERGAILRGLAAQFRLLRICEQMSNGNLEGIDALLGVYALWGSVSVCLSVHMYVCLCTHIMSMYMLSIA